MQPSIKGPIPTQVVVLYQSEVATVLAESEQEHWAAVWCSSTDTQPGDRAVVFELGTRRIIATADFASEPFPLGNGHAAWAAAAELEAPVARDRLLAEPALTRYFRRPRTGSWLDEPARAALTRLMGELPPVQRVSGPVPALGALDLVAFDVDEARDLWASEREMQLALAADAAACEVMGVPVNTPTEVWHDDRSARFDLFAREQGVVIECKLFATQQALTQLDGYVTRLRTSHPDAEWSAALVSAFGFSRDVVRAVARRDDVQLFSCLKRPNGSPLLITIDDTAQLTPITARTRLDQNLEQLLAFFDDATDCFEQLLSAAGLTEDDAELVGDAFDEGDLDAARIPTDPIDELEGRDRLAAMLWVWHELIEQAEGGVVTLARVAGLSDEDVQRASDLVTERAEEAAPPAREALAYIVETSVVDMPAATIVFAADAGLPWSMCGELRNESWTDELALGLDAAMPVEQARSGFVALRDALREVHDLAANAAALAGVDYESVAREAGLTDGH